MFKDLFYHPRVGESSRDLFATFPAHIPEGMGSISWNKEPNFFVKGEALETSAESIVARMDAVTEAVRMQAVAEGDKSREQ